MHPTDRGPTRYSWLLTAVPSLLREGEANYHYSNISPSHSPDKRGACQASTKLAWENEPVVWLQGSLAAARTSFMHPSSHTPRPSTPSMPCNSRRPRGDLNIRSPVLTHHSCRPSHRVRLQHNIGQFASRVISRVAQQIHHFFPLMPVLHQSATWLSGLPTHSSPPSNSLWYSPTVQPDPSALCVCLQSTPVEWLLVALLRRTLT